MDSYHHLHINPVIIHKMEVLEAPLWLLHCYMASRSPVLYNMTTM